MSSSTAAVATPAVIKPTTASQMFVNLPVKDLQASNAFFTALGFAFKPDFCDGNTTCMIIGPNLCSMLMSHEFFARFAPRPIADTSQVCEVLLNLQLESREQVDEIVKRAIAAGGTACGEAEDHGFMYEHGFLDLDGHGWGVFVMNGMPPKAP